MPPQAEQPKHSFPSNRVYDGVRVLSSYILPFGGAIIIVLDRFWPLPKVEQLLGIIITIEVFLGVLLIYAPKAQKTKYVGTMHVVLGTHGGKIFSLELDEDPEDLDTYEQVTFKVQPG